MKYCQHFVFPPFPRLVWCLVLVSVFIFRAYTHTQAQHYHIGLYQGIALPQRSLAETTLPAVWYPSMNLHFFGKNNPITMGTSIGLQYFPRTSDAERLPESYDVMSVPFSICFQYLLLPVPFRPYYGVETGVAWYRYRFYEGLKMTEMLDNVALILTPNAGIKVEIFEGMDVEINVRYQFMFHDIIKWGSNGQMLQGYQTLAFSLGVNYQLWKVYP
jgi:hypothetical protein